MERNVLAALMGELFSRISAKKVFQMKLVSKEWSSLIDSSANFILSRQLPRLLYTYVDGLHRRKFGLAPEDHHPRPFTQTWKIAKAGGKGICSQPIKGLICIHDDCITNYKVEVCNFLTGKWVNLPHLQKDARDRASMFFGLDPINDQFKVLCVCVRSEPSVVTARVISLEGKRSSWRGIGCTNYPHAPIDDSGLYKDGILYYGAWNVKKELLVMTFDMNKEVFRPIDLGVLVPNSSSVHVRMVNYYGSVALVLRRPVTDGSRGFQFEIKVMDKINAEVSTTTLHFLIRGSKPEYKPHLCVGTTASSGVIFAPDNIFNRGFTKKQRPFHKLQLQLDLCCFHPSSHAERYNVRTCDVFTEDIGSLSYIGLQTFLGVVVSYINPAELVA